MAAARRSLLPAWLIVWASVAGGCSTTADFHNLNGVRMYQGGNYQAALQQFQQAVAASPQNADAYYNLASTLHRTGSQSQNRELITQAETVYNQCLDLNENHVECRRGLAVLLVETDRQQSAFKLLSNWVSQQPQSADAQIELARLYEEFGDNDTAKLHLNQAVMLDQRNARAWAALGQMREKAGETEQALANYQRSLQLNPQQPQVGARVATLLRSATPNVRVSGPTTIAGSTAAPATLPPGTLPPGTLPPGTLPPGTLPPGTLAPGPMVPGARTVTAPPAAPRQPRY